MFAQVIFGRRGAEASVIFQTSASYAIGARVGNSTARECVLSATNGDAFRNVAGAKAGDCWDVRKRTVFDSVTYSLDANDARAGASM